MRISTETKIEYIIENNSIVDYLSSVGHDFVRNDGSRFYYICPFPDHKEQKPSFVVYTEGSKQTFWCFGCQRGWNIINLISGLENSNFEETVSRLSSTIKLSPKDILERENKKILDIKKKSDVQMSEHLLDISSVCRSYLQLVQNKPEEVLLIDKLYNLIDGALLECDFESIQACSENIHFWIKQRLEKNPQLKVNSG